MAILEDLKAWADINIKPNVIAIHKIEELQQGGEVTQFDVQVLITIDAGGRTNITTQSVNSYNGLFYIGGTQAKNYIAPEPQETPEERLVTMLDSIYGEDGYIINTPIDTASGKAAVVTIGNEKKVITKGSTGYLVRQFSEV